MACLRVSVIIISVLALSGCGLGVSYRRHEDIIVTIDDNYREQWKINSPERELPYVGYLSREPLEIINIKDGEIRVYNKLTYKGRGVLFIFFPLPIELSDYETSTEIYIRDDDVYKMIYRNGKSIESGFGFVCTPGFGGDGGCEFL